ncbi:DEAD/DEAH box helicase [Saccharicrinis sp. GN24d3]|uniref:DEAD/DEAH box helicase n=1 Tax=Saccharicrinis sp. GN24d3 TaxID=3458416 RepID=UPI004036BE13
MQIQDIWKIHTDVQERMLQLRSAPVLVIPESAKVVGEKLYLKANENDDTDRIIESIMSLFEIDSNSIDIKKGYFYIDISQNANVNSNQKNALAEKAAANFVEFIPNPIIDGYIRKFETPISILQDLMTRANLDYDFDRRGRLQISINDLKVLNKLSQEGTIDIQIPEKASAIIPVFPNPFYFIKKEFPFINGTHKTETYTRDENEEDIFWNRKIEISGGYLKQHVLQRFYDDFGLFLLGYDYKFHINPNVVDRYNPNDSPYYLPNFNKDDSSFLFHTNLNISSESDDLHSELNERWDFDLKYTRLSKFLKSFFGAENVRFESRFIYGYDFYKYTTEFLPSAEYSSDEFWQDIYNSSIKDNASISENTESIGIDFEWRSETVEDKILSFVNKSPVFGFRLFGNHRSNIDFQIQDVSLDSSEDLLREKFPSIKTKRDNRNGSLYFYQEYQSPEQRIMLNAMLTSELETLDANILNAKLCDIPEGKEKYILSVDSIAKKEAQITAIKEIRGADFCINGNYFGKLFRVNYPDMVFDISGDTYEQNKHLFEVKIIDKIEPNLTGDIEKINRLKTSLEKIITNDSTLKNPRLTDFIFDASKATKTHDINTHINSSSQLFQDLDSHLLNKRINEPQKQAILKTLLAEDIALIQGPPGTGKSTAIAEIIWQHIRNNPEERILLTSETNLAVDNAIDRIVNDSHNLVKPIRFGGEEKLENEGRQFSLETMKRWVENGVLDIDEDVIAEENEDLPQKLILHNWIKNIKNRIDQTELDSTLRELWEKTLLAPSKSIREAFYNSYVKNCNVIGATCSSIGENSTQGKATSFFKNYCEIFGSVNTRVNKDGKEYSTYRGDLEFTTVIQDESSKATPAELSLPLIYGKKNIIIGDHRQLPPLLDKESFMMSFDFLLDRTESEEESKKIKRLKKQVNKHFKELEISHFERLFDGIDTSLKGIFNLQYRMHPDINDVIKQFYIGDGGLECGLITPNDMGVNDPNMNNPASRFHGIEIEDWLSFNNHVIWVDTNSPEMIDGTSRVNHGEVDAIHEILTKFRNSDSFSRYQNFWENPEDQQIGLISFYGKQIRLLQDLRNKFRDIPIRVSTVDRFQGMERNIVIVSMVRSNRIATDKNQKPDYTLYGDLGFQEQTDLGFAQSPNRLNVALSRAKRLLIIVGNSELFSQKEIYQNVYQTIANNPNGRIIKYETK